MKNIFSTMFYLKSTVQKVTDISYLLTKLFTDIKNYNKWWQIPTWWAESVYICLLVYMVPKGRMVRQGSPELCWCVMNKERKKRFPPEATQSLRLAVRHNPWSTACSSLNGKRWWQVYRTLSETRGSRTKTKQGGMGEVRTWIVNEMFGRGELA